MRLKWVLHKAFEVSIERERETTLRLRDIFVCNINYYSYVTVERKVVDFIFFFLIFFHYF